MLVFSLKTGSWNSKVVPAGLHKFIAIHPLTDLLEKFQNESCVVLKLSWLFPEGNGPSSSTFPNTGCKSCTPASQVARKINALSTCSAAIKGTQLKCALMDHEIWGEPRVTQGEECVLGGHTVSLMFLWNYHTINWQTKILDFDLFKSIISLFILKIFHLQLGHISESLTSFSW